MGNAGNKEGKEQIDHVIQDTEGGGGDTCRQVHHVLTRKENKEEKRHAN